MKILILLLLLVPIAWWLTSRVYDRMDIRRDVNRHLAARKRAQDRENKRLGIS